MSYLPTGMEPWIDTADPKNHTDKKYYRCVGPNGEIFVQKNPAAWDEVTKPDGYTFRVRPIPIPTGQTLPRQRDGTYKHK